MKPSTLLDICGKMSAGMKRSISFIIYKFIEDGVEYKQGSIQNLVKAILEKYDH